MIGGAIEEEVRFRSYIGVIGQCVRYCAVRSRLSLASGGDVVAGTMVEVVGTVEYLKKNQSTPRPSEHPQVMGGKMSKRLGGIKGCKYKTSSWHLNRFPDADNIGSIV